MTTVAADQPQGSTWQTLRRGLSLSPELRTGLLGTLGLAILSMVGRVAVPVAIQQGIDEGLQAPGGPDVGRIAIGAGLTVAILVVTTACGYLMMRRLFTVSETALASLRVRTFRHIHDLSMLHQQTQRRGVLVARVTSDVDSITQFLQWGGVILLVNSGQILVTTAVMAFYSWQLTLVVLAAFLPSAYLIKRFQPILSVFYGEVRKRVGALYGAVSEAVVGSAVIRAYGVGARTQEKLDDTIGSYEKAQKRALRMSVISFSTGELAAGLAMSAVVIVGIMLGVGGQLELGELVAFLFLVTLFIQPVQIATEVLNEAQNAVSGWRRVLDVLDEQPDVADPAHDGVDLPAGALDLTFDHVSFNYPGGPRVLHDVHLEIPAKTKVAVVGETGSGKTTFAKLLTRLMDPTEGTVLLSGVDLARVRFESLRSHVVMVPQDGFLFDDTIGANVRFARPALTDEELLTAFDELGLGDWLAGLPDGLDTSVGERGEALSVGERQLVALARAYVADPDLLVLDEATSAVDPATEVRLQHTLDAVTRGRTTVAIAHRLSTAQAADEVIVVDKGVIVQRGPHEELVQQEGSVYARLYASWLEQTR
ncbi:MAG: ABC transporter ATP-binding protein [Hamadaea sp.]|nr:ABC transporter ATP-binding protein [Hamadaea sp.]